MHAFANVCVSVFMLCIYRVPTPTGKWRSIFQSVKSLVILNTREKSANFTQSTGKVGEMYTNTGEIRKFWTILFFAMAWIFWQFLFQFFSMIFNLSVNLLVRQCGNPDLVDLIELVWPDRFQCYTNCNCLKIYWLSSYI